jgi:hypothetical protein
MNLTHPVAPFISIYPLYCNLDSYDYIITILDDTPTKNHAEEQKKALEAFREGLNACEPLPPEFDEIVSKRVNIARTFDI